MAKGDIIVYSNGAFGYPGDLKLNVAASTAGASINAGEPVCVRALGNTTVYPAWSNFPVVASDYIAGIAATASTETTTAAGEVRVTKIVPGMSFLIKPNAAATWDGQSEYDAFVGKRVLIDLTTGSYTLLASDSANNGCVVLPLDVAKYPGRVRVAFRNALSIWA